MRGFLAHDYVFAPAHSERFAALRRAINRRALRTQGGAVAYVASGDLRSAVVAAATLLFGPTGLKGGEHFSREVLVTRESRAIGAGRLRLKRGVYSECETRAITWSRRNSYRSPGSPFPSGKSVQFVSEVKSSQPSPERWYYMGLKVTF